MPIIEWSPSPNYSSRCGRKPIAIVDHITAGKFPGCLEWMKNPVSQVSAHYLVTKTGRIFQLVKEEAKAWHAGIIDRCTWALYDETNPNLYTIGIEHEGQSGDIMPEVQYQASLWLHKEIIYNWEIPIDTDHIIPHNIINADHSCPGPGFPWERLFKDLKGEVDILDVAILKFSPEDEWAAKDIDARLGGVASFTRLGTSKVIPRAAMRAKKLIVVGGPTTGHPNEVLLSGQTKYDTALAVGKYLG